MDWGKVRGGEGGIRGGGKCCEGMGRGKGKGVGG